MMLQGGGQGSFEKKTNVKRMPNPPHLGVFLVFLCNGEYIWG